MLLDDSGSLCSVRSTLCVVIGTIRAHVVYGRVVLSFFLVRLYCMYVRPAVCCAFFVRVGVL